RLTALDAEALLALAHQALGQLDYAELVAVVQEIDQRRQVDPGHDHHFPARLPVAACPAPRGARPAHVARATPELGQHDTALRPVRNVALDRLLERVARKTLGG